MKLFHCHIVVLFLLLVSPLPSIAQDEILPLTNAFWVDKIEEKDIPSEIKIRENFIGALGWTDIGGNHLMVVYETQTAENDPGITLIENYINFSGNENGWDATEDDPECSINGLFLRGTFQLIDLDGDNTKEFAFGVQEDIEEDGKEYWLKKYYLFYQKEIYRLHAKIPKQFGDDMTSSFKGSNGTIPILAKNFLQQFYDSHSMGGENMSAFRMKSIEKNFRIMESWQLLGSEGVFYRLQNSNGEEIEFPGEIARHISLSFDILKLPNVDKIIYADSRKVYLLDITKKEERTLGEFKQAADGISTYAISPSGTRIAFTSVESLGKTFLHVLTFYGEDVKYFERDLPVFKVAASSWIVEGVKFLNDFTIEYGEWFSPDNDPVVKTLMLE